MDLITKLNSDFQLFGQAQRFAAGYDEENDIAYTTCFAENGKNKQINIRNDGIWCYTFDGGNSKKLWETALKSDLSDFVKVLQFNTITESWAAGAENRVTIPIPAPSGYRTISIVRAWVSNPFILTANAYIEGASVIVHGRNIENNVLENVYAYANILYVKS